MPSAPLLGAATTARRRQWGRHRTRSLWRDWTTATPDSPGLRHKAGSTRSGAADQNHRGLWVARTVTVRRLEDLRRQADYQLAGLADGEVQPAVVDGLLARLDQIVADDQQAWLRLRSIDAQPASTAPKQKAAERPS
jgi:hypothetical protein